MAIFKKKQKRKVVCEDDVCLLEVDENASADDSSVWLDIFCPQESCEITSPTQLP